MQKFINIDDIIYKPKVRNIAYNANNTQGIDDIKVMTYNILKPYVYYNIKYKDIQKEANIKWFYRWELIKREIDLYDPDIICFQEVQNNIFYTDMNPYFVNSGYTGIFIAAEPPKTDEEMIKIQAYNTTMKSGISIFYKNRFSLIHAKTLNFLKNVKKLLKIEKTQISHIQKLNKYFAYCSLVLEDNKTQKRLVISNLHIINKADHDDVKTYMIYLILKDISILSKKHRLPVVLTGDFNSLPSCCLYEGITTGRITGKYEFESNPKILPVEPVIEKPDFFTPFPLKSSYFTIFNREPRYTNYAETFKETLDYIFYNDKIKLIGVLEEVDLSHKVKIPDDEYPSDHLLLMAIFNIN